MRVPERLAPLIDEGVIDEVLRPLMSGKEAQVFLVIAGGVQAVAKVYKEADERSFKNRADYTEGRKVRNSRQMRAMQKKSTYGAEQIEQAWRTAEVDAIYKLRAAQVRVPEPYAFVDGVLVMELVTGEDGLPAPRLVDCQFEEQEASDLFQHLLWEVQRMLLAGVVHGDLSDFNVLIGVDGPVIIDFPQATDPAHNNNARKLLIRDVSNLELFLARFWPDLKRRKYGEEMWDLYERGELTQETKLTGNWKRSGGPTDTSSLLQEIEFYEREARARRAALGLPDRPARAPKAAPPTPPPAPPGKRGGGQTQPARGGPKPKGGPPQRGPQPPRGGPPQRSAAPPQRSAPPPRPPPPPPLEPESAIDDIDALLFVEED